jgi:hypothetical protein
MMTSIPAAYHPRFEELKKNLSTMTSKESSFTQVELLFFEAISLSRSYGDESGNNDLLNALKELQQEQYVKANAATRKPAQREQQIRKFIIQFKRILSVTG